MKIGIIGLGYVGLPLALAFGKHYQVMGYDVDTQLVDTLNIGKDPRGEVGDEEFFGTQFTAFKTIEDISSCNVYIVTVPTPVTHMKLPDLRPLQSASRSIGKVLSKGDYVIYESTVYPGCTEEDCIPLLVQSSGLSYPSDFRVGYSPERINPGDKVHRLDNTTKIVSGDTDEALAFIANLYAKIITPGVHQAPSIKVAEAAKIIENAQRDLNIAFMNELSIIFDLMDINTLDVIEAAGTKWNFLKFMPGLVGGHCISVDPYYLTYKAQELGYKPEIILSGRKVNDNLSKHVVRRALEYIEPKMNKGQRPKVLILGITFKENVSDLRNSKILEVVKEFQSYNIDTDVYDPHVDANFVLERHKIEMSESIDSKYDVIILAVKHDIFKKFDEPYFLSISNPDAVLMDVKSMKRGKIVKMKYWSL